MRVRLPANGWAPRPYQQKLWQYFEGGGKRYVGVWHRRAGKDENLLHLAAVKAHERPATYWHMLPQASQARKAIWEAINPHTGIRRIDEAFPLSIRETTRDREMMIRFLNGSTWQLAGSDNFNSLVGSPPAGVVFSEWSLANPSAWNFIRPILLENGGWAAFIYTPRGPNHGLDLLNQARATDGWFSEVLTVADTGVFTEEQLKQERIELRGIHGTHGDAIFEQEYMCSFQAAVIGAYYGHEMEAVAAENRIVPRLYDKTAGLVNTAWDLGAGDDTVIVFYQTVGLDIRVIDYYAANGWGLDHYAGVLRERGYAYGRHYLPHDVEIRVLSGGEVARTRRQTLESLGVPVSVVPKWSLEDGINAVRRVLPRMWFDAEKAEHLVKALRQYRREWDDTRKVFYERPLHDWASHPADAVRYLAISVEEPRAKKRGSGDKPDTSWIV